MNMIAFDNWRITKYKFDDDDDDDDDGSGGGDDENTVQNKEVQAYIKVLSTNMIMGIIIAHLSSNSTCFDLLWIVVHLLYNKSTTNRTSGV